MREHGTDKEDQAPHLSRDDAQDRIYEVLTHLRRVLQSDGGAYWKADTQSQKRELRKWAESLDLLIDPQTILPYLLRGGQEHDILDLENSSQVIKVTRKGTFGLHPGIDLAMVSEGKDARKLHLWEASPYNYLERLHLQNQLTPGLNRLEGFIVPPIDSSEFEFSIVTSQPRFKILPATEDEIDQWFLNQGFQRVASASYYRKEDNLGVFDAHDKNVLHSPVSPEILIPFDVIPCHPDEGFKDFIETALANNFSLHQVRTTHTTDR